MAATLKDGFMDSSPAGLQYTRIFSVADPHFVTGQMTRRVEESPILPV
jgi:hypothetical protein